jgi:hypothetical protein
MKTCSKCKVEKPFEEFGKRKNNYQSSCKECHNKYYQDNKEKKTEYYKKYREDNKEKRKKYYQENKEILKEKRKKYIEKNKEKRREYLNEYQKKYIFNRRKIDPLFKFRINIRSLIKGSFKRGTNQFTKKAKTETILCCTIEEFINYIQSKFTKGMTLENHGEWHLDHIIPLATATTEEEIIKLNHYTNFQPLWAEENLSKSDKIIDQQLKLL